MLYWRKKGKANDECIIYNEFELKQESFLGFGAGADWWIEAYLNGEKIFSNLSIGNGVYPCSVNDCIFFGKGKKGRNLLTVLVRRGIASWAFCITEKPYVSVHPAAPVSIIADRGKILEKIKPMNAVNNGPVKTSRGLGNMEEWKAAAIPYVRNHDASFCSIYGGEHTVDEHMIFPDFSKDADDPASYDFALTDRYLKTIFESGSKIFYRLGSKIEHAPKKYGTRVPADFKKWAVICEHIIRHYNEGWADGFKMNIEYWEIWNEPNLGYGTKGVSPTWQGTPEQFHELFCSGKCYGCTKYIDVTNDARSQVPRESYAYKHAFMLRTEVERYFSRMGDREAEQTSHFNYLSIRNQMSIAHLTLSLTALAACILKRSDKIRCFRSFADAA